jgi:hypothetical protein
MNVRELLAAIAAADISEDTEVYGSGGPLRCVHLEDGVLVLASWVGSATRRCSGTKKSRPRPESSRLRGWRSIWPARCRPATLGYDAWFTRLVPRGRYTRPRFRPWWITMRPRIGVIAALLPLVVGPANVDTLKIPPVDDPPTGPAGVPRALCAA